MDGKWSGPLLLIAGVGGLFWWFTGGLSAPGVDGTRFIEALPGVYEDDAGRRLELWFEETEPASTVLGPMIGLDGRLASVDVVAPGQTDGGWNFGYHEPLVLNLVLEPGVGRFARVELEPDGLRLRVSDDPEAVMRQDFLRGPEVMVLRRVEAR